MRQTIDRVGKYDLRAVLARTPLSTVYDGWDSDIARRVAIKMIPLSVSGDSDEAEALVRFKRGAQAAGKLNHPNIVAVYDYGESDGYAYLVMEFIDGSTLKEKFDSHQRFGQPETHSVVGSILEALQYSHDRGVVHRDIKPANIMFTQDNKVKITDFGIARIEDSEMTQAGMVIGTPAYMSPEQFLGEKIDARTDIYSTGVVLYQILTGERPYEGNLATIMHKVLYGEPPSPSRISTLVTPSLDRIVTRAMARNRDERFPTAAAFNTALQATLGPVAPRVQRTVPLPPPQGTKLNPARLAGEPRRPPPSPTARSRPRGLLLASLGALLIGSAGIAAWYLHTNAGPAPQTVAVNHAAPPAPPQPAALQPTPPQTIRAQPAEPPRAADTAAAIPAEPAPLPRPPDPSPRPDTAAADQQERVRTAASNFIQKAEPAQPVDPLPPPVVVPDLPLPPSPATNLVPWTPPGRETPAPPPPARKPFAAGAPYQPNANQIGPAHGNPDRRPATAETRPLETRPPDAKPLDARPLDARSGKSDNNDRFTTLTDPRPGDASDATLRRLRADPGNLAAPPPAAPPLTAPRPPPTYAAYSSSAVGLICQSVTAETAGGYGLDTPHGIVVTGVTVGSAAARAGILQDDVILKIRDKDAYSLSVLSQAAAETAAGQTVPLDVLRRGNHLMVQLQVDQLRR